MTDAGRPPTDATILDLPPNARKAALTEPDVGPATTAAALSGAAGALDSYPGPAARTDPQGRVVAVNAIAGAFLAPGMPWCDVDSRGDATPQTGAITSFGDATDHLVIQWVAVPDGTGGQTLFGMDATLDTSLRTALAESRQRFRDLAELSGDLAWETDADGRLTYVSVGPSLGHRPADLIGRSAESLLAAAVDGVSPFAPDRTIRRVPVWLKTAAGGQVCMAVSARPVVDSEGRRCGARGIGEDITERQAREAHLARLHERDRLVGSMAAAMRTDPDPEAALAAAITQLGRAMSAAGATAVLMPANKGSLRLVGNARSLRGRPLNTATLLATATMAVRGNDMDRRSSADGHVLTLPCGRHGEDHGLLTLWRPAAKPDFSDSDVDLAQAAAPQIAYGLSQVVGQALLRRQADHDPLTGLLNRAAMTKRLRARLETEAPCHGALLYVDLDNFKAVNDTLGHAKGDAALTRVSAIFQQSLDTDTLIGRMGGDEFVVWVETQSSTRVREMAEALVTAGHGLGDLSAAPDRPLGLSVGIATFDPARQETVDSLVERADTAMYAAKRMAKQRGAQGGWTWAERDRPE